MGPDLDASLEVVASKYFVRLNEILVQHFPDIPLAVLPEPCTLSAFHLAIQRIQRKYQPKGLGLMLGSRIRVSDYGVVGLAMASTVNLAEAIDTQMRYLKMIANANKIYYDRSRHDQLMRLTVKERFPGEVPDQFIIESELAAQVRFISDLMPSEDMSKCTMDLPFDCPTTPHHYRSLVPCRMRFRQGQASFSFPFEWMDKPLQTSDGILAPLLVERCNAIMARMDSGSDWIFKVRNYLLTSGNPMLSLIATADALGVPIHTLRLRLYQSGTSYKQIVLDVRMQLAAQYLEDTPLTLQQISYQLGYSQTSNFQLAFRKYFSVAPGQWRRLAKPLAKPQPA